MVKRDRLMFTDDYAPKARKPYMIMKQRERWTEEEHKKFLEALKLYGRAWRRIEDPLKDLLERTKDLRSIQMILEYIKALLTGQEMNFILVSCTGSRLETSRREQVLRAKKAGEDSHRRTGLGCTIIFPGPLMEESGGQQALIFLPRKQISHVRIVTSLDTSSV